MKRISTELNHTDHYQKTISVHLMSGSTSMERPLPPLPGDGGALPTGEDDIEEDDHYAILPDQRAVCLKLDPLEDGGDGGAYLTPLRQLLASYTLPIRVRAGPAFLGAEDSELKEGDGLMLHFIVQRKRVLSMDDNSEDTILPLHATQRYDVLPRERLHDDVIFQTTSDIINCIPLPEKVRILKDFTDTERDTNLKKGDGVTVSGVEEAETDGISRVKTLVGLCNGNRISLPDGFVLSCTTMVEEEPQTLRQVVQKNDLPVRIRRSDDKVEMTIQEFREEAHVIATHLTKKRIISIPVSALVNLRYEESDEALAESAIPLYEFVNWTLCSTEIDRQPLPLPLQEIPQPLERVLRQWLDSSDGRDIMQEAIERYASYSSCSATGNPDRHQEYENFTPPEMGSIRRKTSIRDKIRSMTGRTKSIESRSDTYDSLSRLTDGQILANAQIQEMKTVLSVKEKENQRLKEENERIQCEIQETKDQLTELTAMNKQYVQKLHQMYIETGDIDGGMELKPPRARSNEYVGITTTNITNSKGDDMGMGGTDEVNIESTGAGRDLSEASVNDIAEFLNDLDFGGYIENFRDEHVDGKLLLDLDFETLHEDLGMSRLHAKRLLLELQKH